VGTALGGSVEMLIEGELIEVTTLSGESPAQVASSLAIAILANSALASLGVTATVFGETLVVGGSIESVVISDSGLAPAVPIGPLVGPAVIVLMLGYTTLVLGGMQASPPRSRL
jgi:hypothetical protein